MVLSEQDTHSQVCGGELGRTKINYYSHHLGDYAAATAHLTWLEDLSYTRLLRLYYSTEKPIPADVARVYRLVRASAKQEREAVDAVLAEFFTLSDDGYHNKRCDEEIAKAQESTEENEAKKRNERERQNRHRQRRRELFEELRGYGSIPKWDTTLAQLETLVSQYQSRTSNAPVTRDRPLQEHDLQRLSINQEPITNNQEEVKPLSGKPDPASQNFKNEAREIIDFLNMKTGRAYQHVDANLKLVIARLKDGESPDDIRAVIAMRCRKWGGDPKMDEYLRPATLFAAKNYAQYRGELIDGDSQELPGVPVQNFGGFDELSMRLASKFAAGTS